MFLHTVSPAFSANARPRIISLAGRVDSPRPTEGMTAPVLSLKSDFTDMAEGPSDLRGYGEGLRSRNVRTMVFTFACVLH